MKFRSGLGSCIAKKSSCMIVLTLLLIILWAALPSAGSAKPAGDNGALVPAPFLKWPEKGSDHAILVDKSQQKVFIYKKDDPSEPVKTYTCSTGENDGKKSKQNDRKTPEGIYFFINVFEQKNLAPIYGVRAFPLDYPNPVDRREGRDGYGIWFHGLNKPLKPKDTNGCVALENRDIDDISSYIKLNDTPVVISSKMELIEPEKLQKEREELERLIEGWRKAWEGKQVDRYMSYYSPQFTSGKKDWKAWKEYKARLARQYKEIRVQLDNLALFRNDGTAMASFNQQYTTSAFDSKGIKRLFLQQNSSQWKIVGEYFDTPEERPVIAVMKRTVPEAKAAPAKKPVSTASSEIRAFIESWRKAWEKKDLKTYIACYDPGFSSRGMDLQDWRKHREGLNEQHQSLAIELKDMKIRESSGDTATVTFIQDYRADEYRDLGLKNILLTKRGAHWKIKKEDWRALRKPRQ
jgi:murein L,D-transpeptidase YafK